ncbi:MAG TPA: xanthine dehydrogenase family protein molybdopterin-binding subunit, partial [Myxococcales bacterium]|nr:xanthine dehydrogenase family protein molybdopterin-binding subunit [Myxococcales bacterium]
MTAVGKPLIRREAHAKVTGGARYTYEVPVAGVLYGVMVTSRCAKGRVTAMDTAEAERHPGVAAILTPFNAMKLPGPIKAGDPADRTLHVLQGPEIEYSNQPIALAVADTFERAVHAANLVRVTEAADPFTVDFEAELPNGFPHDLMTGGHKLPADQLIGNIQKGLEPAYRLAARVEAVYRTPPETHNPMEPHATLAIWSSATQLLVYDATQGIFGVRKKLATVFALEPKDVRVITKFVGGGFGCKGTPWSHVPLAALASKQIGKPVKIALTRHQMFGMVGGRPQTHQKILAAATPDGQLTSLRHESWSATSRFDDFVEGAALPSRHSYAVPNLETKHRLVRVDIATPTYMRAPGESSGSFALESAMDELAVQMNTDPMRIRFDNHCSKDPAEGKPFSSKSVKECYRIAATSFGWQDRPKRPGTLPRKNGKLVGYGMATASYPANQAKSDASVKVDAKGDFLVEAGTIDMGGGSYTVYAQVAADALGVDVEKVRFDLGDTDMPEAPRSGGSITAASVATAVEAACAALKEKLVLLATRDQRSPVYGLTDAKAEDGKVVSGLKSETFGQIAARNAGAVDAHAHTDPLKDRDNYALHSFGAQFAEVHVDPELGMVKVARLHGCFAAGRILNERLARSQFLGGMVWGIGMALHERTVYDQKLGRIMSRD